MSRKSGKGKIYRTPNGHIRVVRVKGGKTVQLDKHGNVLVPITTR